MHFYRTIKAHVPSPEDLLILKCRCGWTSKELTVPELSERGIPWYCDKCGRRNLRFIRFAPHERAGAYAEFGIMLPPSVEAI